MEPWGRAQALRLPLSLTFKSVATIVLSFGFCHVAYDAREVQVLSSAVTSEMSLEEVKVTLKQLISEVCGVPAAAIHDETTIDQDLQMPSVVFVELQVAAEETFDMLLDPVELIELNTFGRIANAIHARIADREHTQA